MMDIVERLREKPKLTPVQYWYKEAMAYEKKARRYKVALERIRDSGYGTKERIRLIIKKALEEKE